MSLTVWIIKYKKRGAETPLLIQETQ